MKQPYVQGALDGLRGIYSLINAAKIINNLSDAGCSKLFEEIITHLDQSRKLSRILIEGLNITIIGEIFNKVIKNKIPHKKMPYKSKSATSLDQFWTSMQEFLDSDNRAILIGLGGVHDNWTVVKSISDKQIKLFDTEGLQILNRAKCTTQAPTASRIHRLHPTQTYFLS